MNHYFLDSSALIKRYIIEQGTNWTKSLIQLKTQNLIIISDITQVEVTSGVMRRKREGAINPQIAHGLKTVIENHIVTDYQVIGLSQPIIKRAKDLLEAYPLRAYDAIQLASALESHHSFMQKNLSPIIFLSSDNRLLTTAISEGLLVDNPNNYP
jgi:predicted nucleic acid-binding protein